MSPIFFSGLVSAPNRTLRRSTFELVELEWRGGELEGVRAGARRGAKVGVRILPQESSRPTIERHKN